jgi:WD40 repeat protein/serine/threonine protein kinase
MQQPVKPDPQGAAADDDSVSTVARASAPSAADAESTLAPPRADAEDHDGGATLASPASRTNPPAGDDDGESTLASPSNRTPPHPVHHDADGEATLASPGSAAAGSFDGEATLATPLTRSAPDADQGDGESTLAGDGQALTPSASPPSASDSGRTSRGSPAIDGDLAGAPVYVEQPGRYQIRRQFGAGGQGVIWLAFDATVGREVALKALDVPRLLTAGVNLPVTEQRFLREARITGQLEHPGIAPVHDLGRRADGSVYYVQKLVRGRTLRDALKECKTAEERLRLLPHYIDICQAIAYAHGRGVIHRDLKPENVMVGEFGETVVLDWGLAKVRGKADGRGAGDPGQSGRLAAPSSSQPGQAGQSSQSGKLAKTPQLFAFGDSADRSGDGASSETRDGEVLGTPLYMSPEQAAGRLVEVDERSDVWALGAMLYEVLCGRAPFAGGKVSEVIARARKGIAPRVKELAPDAPAELAAVAERAIAKDRDARYPSAQALAAEIETFTLGGRVSAYSYTPWELLTKLVRRSPLASGLALFALVTLIVSTVMVRRDHKQALSALSETLAIHAASAEVEQRWAQAAAWYAAARAQEERPEARFGEAMAEQLAPRPLLRLGPHVKPAQGVVFSRDGRKVITTDSEGTLTVWDSASGKLLSRVDAHKTLTPALAISPRADAPLIATGGSDGRLRLWDLSLTAVVDLAGSADPALQPKPDKDHADRSGYEEGSEGLPVLGISSATFSLDGALLASASLEDGVSVWDVKSRARLANFGSGHDRTLGLAFTADGKRVFSGGLDGAVVLHDFAGEVLWRNRAHDSRVRVIATSPDGQWMASGGQDNSVVLYAMGPIEKAAVPGHESEDPDAEVREVAADPAEVSGWKKSKNNGTGPKRLEGHQRAISGLAFSPDSSVLASTSRDGIVVLWDVASGRPVARLDADERASNGLGWSADGAMLAAAFQDQVVQVWKMPERRRMRALGGHTDAVRAVAFAPGGGLLVSTGLDGTIRTWDRDTGKQVRSVMSAAKKKKARVVAISPDGRQLASGGEGDSFELWDMATGARERLVGGLPEGTSALAYDPRGGRLYSGHRKGMLRVIDPATGQVLAQTPSGHPVVEAVAVSPDSKLVATSGSDGLVMVLDARTLTRIVKLEAHNEAGRGVAFSPDGTLLASGGADRRLVIYNTADWSIARELGGHHGRIQGVVFSPDGKLLGTSCVDQGVRIFDPRTGQLIYSVTRHEAAVLDLAWSPDGRTLASASSDKTIELLWVDGTSDVPLPKQALSSVLSTHGLRLVGQRVEPLAQRDRSFSGDGP